MHRSSVEVDVDTSAAVRDEQLCIRVGRALASAGYRDLRKVRVVVRDRCVALRGRVPSYFLKQLAQSAARTVDGVELIHNEIEVRE